MSEAVARRVYVISDLHLGGTYGKTSEGRGFRINTHVNMLAEFVDGLAASPADEPNIELVINGDMVDFLAEKESGPPFWKPFTFDSDAACAKLQAIAGRDPRFFRALGSFLDHHHRLTILTGNHDIELAMPAVRRKLRQLIGVKPGHDYEVIHNGEAYSVGEAVIEHGNRYDRWNVVNHDGLRRLSALLSRRQPVAKKSGFEPPAGSKLVSWVINEIKEDYKFIDLLKPVTDAAVPLLLALEPGYRQILATVAKLGLQARGHRMEAAAIPSFGGDISAEGNPDSSAYGSDMRSNSGEFFESTSAPGDDDSALQQILRERLGKDTPAFLEVLPSPASTASGGIGGDISAGSFIDRTLGLARLLFARDDQDIACRLPALLRALQSLQASRDFEMDYEPAREYSNAAMELFKGGFRYVIFGHSHLAKKIELPPGSGNWYLNSGTWADLMQLPQEIITAAPAEARAKLEPFVQNLGEGQLERWIVFHPTFVQLDLDAADHILRADVVAYKGSSAVGS